MATQGIANTLSKDDIITSRETESAVEHFFQEIKKDKQIKDYKKEIRVLKEKVHIFLTKVESTNDYKDYLKLHSLKIHNESYDESRLLQLERDLIRIETERYNNAKSLYQDFFEIQNKINAILDQIIIVAYVDVNGAGKSTIYLNKNSGDLLKSSKAEYITSKLKDGIRFEYKAGAYPDVENLRNASKTTIKRYEKNSVVTSEYTQTIWSGTGQNRQSEQRTLQRKKHLIYALGTTGGASKIVTSYILDTMGAINEAFVNFYINKAPIGAGEIGIQQFIDDPAYGVKIADSAPGFVKGDSEITNNTYFQFAVKGFGGSPQGYAETLNYLKRLEKALDKDDIEWDENKIKETVKTIFDPLIPKEKEKKIPLGKEYDDFIQSINKITKNPAEQKRIKNEFEQMVNRIEGTNLKI